MDFQYEVSRALKACEGAVLLVDATRGVQAGTISNFWLAFEAGLHVIPVLNKVDLDHADVEKAQAQLRHTFGFEESIRISAKTNLNCLAVLDAVVAQVPPPPGGAGQLRALLYDAWFDRHSGAVMVWRMLSGKVQAGSSVMSIHSRKVLSIHRLKGSCSFWLTS